MSIDNSSSATPATPDYFAPQFRGALMKDHWEGDGEWSTVSTNFIGEIDRASDAVETIARLVHNSLCEPAMSGAEPLGLSAHLGLLNAAELIARYMREIAERMREQATFRAEFDKTTAEADHE
jgi:hypothetical protein